MLHEQFPNLRAAIVCPAAHLAVLPLIPRTKEPAIARDRADDNVGGCVKLVEALKSARPYDRTGVGPRDLPDALFEAVCEPAF